MNFYECRQEVRKHLNDNDVRFLDELARIAEKYHAESIHSRIGYEVLGPALLGYTSWLHSEAVKFGAGMIVFLAREGRILKRAYDQLFSQESIKTVYINVSRVSLCRASVVYTKSFDDILRLFTNTVLRSGSKVSQMFELLGIPECADEYPDSDRQIAEISDTQELYALIMRRGMTYFYRQNMLLKKYLADKGIAGGTIILSDIGYSGTMQALLSNIIPYVRSIGCYVISSEHNRYKRNFMFRKPEVYGYWNSDKEAWPDAGYHFSRLMSYGETLFLSAEGTTTEYVEITKGGGAVEPVKDKEKPEPKVVSLINTAQDAALKYLADSHFNTEEICSINPNVFFTPIINLLASQDSEVRAFYNGMNFMGKPLTPAKSRLYYFMHPILAHKEIKSRESPEMWRRYIFGRLYGVYSVLIRPARILKHKFAALKSLYAYHSRAERISRAYDLAAAYPVISFDVFDTLIFRKCTPLQVFDAAEKKYNALRSGKDKAESFREHRVKAQARAGIFSVQQEVTFDEIYYEIADEYGGDFAESMKTAEIDAELEAVYPNAEMQSFYNAMKAAGKRIIIASDMYLPGKVIAALLEKCGYDGYTSLYVSSDCRVRKSSGLLFRRIVREERVSPSEILHIGDNMHSDCLMAEREGLRGFLYKK